MTTTQWTQSAGMTSATEVDNITEFAEQSAANAAAALASKVAAEASKVSAAASAIQSSSSASNAATSASASDASKTSAETAETNAETAETNAETAETNASASATTATNQAVISTTKAGEAATSATTATTKASEASTSAANAATSETNAAASATASANSATASANSATAAAAVLVNPSFTGNISVTGTVDGRDVASDGTKLDGIEAGADVTDTGNVASAGALMDSEVTNLSQVKSFDGSDYATAAQGTKADTAHGWGNHASAGYTTPAAAESNALALAIALG